MNRSERGKVICYHIGRHNQKKKAATRDGRQPFVLKKKTRTPSATESSQKIVLFDCGFNYMDMCTYYIDE